MTFTERHVSGVLLPLVTPFSDGEVDEQSLTQLVARYRATGITGVVLAGTTGESPVLSGSEVQRLVEHVAGELDGALPIYLGVAGNDTRSVVADIASHDRLSVDGYLVAAPYYNRPSQAGLSAHFDAVARQTDRAVIVYNIPYRTGVNLENGTLLTLADRHSNVVGVKDSQPEQGSNRRTSWTSPASRGSTSAVSPDPPAWARHDRPPAAARRMPNRENPLPERGRGQARPRPTGRPRPRPPRVPMPAVQGLAPVQRTPGPVSAPS